MYYSWIVHLRLPLFFSASGYFGSRGGSFPNVKMFLTWPSGQRVYQWEQKIGSVIRTIRAIFAYSSLRQIPAAGVFLSKPGDSHSTPSSQQAVKLLRVHAPRSLRRVSCNPEHLQLHGPGQTSVYSPEESSLESALRPFRPFSTSFSRFFIP